MTTPTGHQPPGAHRQQPPGAYYQQQQQQPPEAYYQQQPPGPQAQPGRPGPGFDVPRPQRRGRTRKGIIITVLVLGWVCLLWATDLTLLAAIQVGMIGLGAIGTAITLAVWPGQQLGS